MHTIIVCMIKNQKPVKFVSYFAQDSQLIDSHIYHAHALFFLIFDFLIDTIWEYRYLKDDYLIESGGGTGPVKPRQPFSNERGANSSGCKFRKMR
jgi:hypothetical protein